MSILIWDSVPTRVKSKSNAIYIYGDPKRAECKSQGTRTGMGWPAWSVESGEVWDSPLAYVHGEETGFGHRFSPKLSEWDDKIGG